MKTILCAFIITFSSSLHCQESYKNIFRDSIKEIQWDVGIVYLPTIQSEGVALTATSSRLKATYYKLKNGRYWKKLKKRRIRISKESFAQLYNRYLALTSPSFAIALTDADKDSLRAKIRDTTWNGDRRFKLTAPELERYLEADSLIVEHSVFAKDSIHDINGNVIDGAPFRFNMKNININDDTLSFIYEGNLAGGDKYRDLGKNLTIRILDQESKLFEKLPLDYFFTKDSYYVIIISYLEGKEGLLEFIPLSKWLEQLELNSD
ncbi:MAG: hypothetical protein ACFHU9_16805 [Fluviicola sp.]